MPTLEERPVIQGFAGAIGIALAWEALPRILMIPGSILPPFTSVLSVAILKLSLLSSHMFETLEESVLGFFIALILAGLVAILVEESKWAERIFLYPMIALQNVPKVALAPLLVLWLQYGIGPKIAMAALIAFFPIFEGFRSGLTDDRTGLRRTLSVFGPSRLHVLMRVKLPEAMPGIFQGLRVGITFANIGAIVGEIAQPSSGLGYILEMAKDNMQTNLQYAAVLSVSILGLLLYGIVAAVELLPYIRRYSLQTSRE